MVLKKRITCMSLAILLSFSFLCAACGAGENGNTEKTGETTLEGDAADIMQKGDPSKDDTLNILMIGNSFCYYYVEELYGMLKAAGIEANICNVYYSGCAVKQHWTWWKSGEANYDYYTTNANGRVKTEKVNLAYCLQQRNWDVISLQDSSSDLRKAIVTQIYMEKTELWRKELIGYIKEQFPQSRYMWHQTWSYQVGYDRNGYQMTSLAQQEKDIQLMKEFSMAVCKEQNFERVNTGEAWQLVRQDGYDNLCARLSKNYGVGDYYHDGDIGGGAYINACVYFEVMTGISCVGNTWRPTDYTLPETLVPILQDAAHKAVLDAYGEEHYTGSWTDKVGNDNAWNILILGSSNCGYLRDELQAIAEHAGIDTRVFHAYSSGVEIQTQWDWISNGNGKYDTHDITSAGDSLLERQKITDFIEKYQWDSIITYQTAGEFNDELPYSETGWNNVLADLRNAHNFYNWIYQRCPAADYHWYQTVAAPYGVPSTDGFEGRIFADNCTQAVFAGWDELEEGEKVHTSITFGNNVNFKDNSASRVAAVGYLENAPEVAYTDATARQVKYLEAEGYDNIADIRPTDVHASIIVNGEDNLLGLVNCKLGYAPSDAALVLKNGEVFRAWAAGTEGKSENPYYGDITMEYYKDIYISNWTGITTDIIGDVTMIYDGYEWAKNMSTIGEGHTVDGDFTVDVRDGNLNCSLYVAGHGYTDYSTVTGTVTFRWGGGHINGVYTGRKSNVGNLTNEFYCNPDAQVPASTDKSYTMAGASTCVVEGTVSNTYIGAVPEGILNNISRSGGDGSHTKIVNTVKADAEGNAPSFKDFCGGVTSGRVTEIVNNIEAGSFGTYVGGSPIDAGTIQITNKISGGLFNGDTQFGDSNEANVKTVISGGTFTFDPSNYLAKDCMSVQNDGGSYTVIPAYKPGLAVAEMPYKTIYHTGEELSTNGLVLLLTRNDGSTQVVNSGYTVTGFNSAKVGKNTITVTCDGKSANFDVIIVDDTITAVDNSGNMYTDFFKALADSVAGSKLILANNVSGNVTVAKDLCIDLNGHSVTGTVTVKDGFTLYGADAQTDDYTIRDAAGYGKIKVICEGNGKVQGLPEESELAKDGYLMVTEGEEISFHRVNLQITHMTLRASEAGVYFQSDFAGDELGAARVAKFGVVMSLTEAPTAEDLKKDYGYSWFAGFEAGENNQNTSTLLKNVMKETNPDLINNRNANMPVYGRTYVLLTDGTYLFGGIVARSLRQQVEGVDMIWESLNTEQQFSAIAMYRLYEPVMKHWDIPEIIDAANAA